jgi:hypothetical protein
VVWRHHQAYLELRPPYRGKALPRKMSVRNYAPPRSKMLPLRVTEGTENTEKELIFDYVPSFSVSSVFSVPSVVGI